MVVVRVLTEGLFVELYGLRVLLTGEGEVADIPDIPSMPQAPVPVQAVDDVAGWVQTLSMIVQLAACVAIGVLAWFLYQNTQTNYF